MFGPACVRNGLIYFPSLGDYVQTILNTVRAKSMWSLDLVRHSSFCPSKTNSYHNREARSSEALVVSIVVGASLTSLQAVTLNQMNLTSILGNSVSVEFNIAVSFFRLASPSAGLNFVLFPSITGSFRSKVLDTPEYSSLPPKAQLDEQGRRRLDQPCLLPPVPRSRHHDCHSQRILREGGPSWIWMGG